jgi:hypothetical protein
MSVLKQFKCKVFNPDATCTFTVTGDEKSVVEQASAHEVAEHGFEDTPQLRNEIIDSLVDVNQA